MSEPSFPFGGQTPAGRPVQEPPANPAASPDRRRKLLLGAGAGLVAAAVAVGGYVLVSGGGGATAPTGAVAKGRPSTPASSPTATATLPQTFDGVIGVDPFAALVVPAAAASAAPAGPPSPTVTVGSSPPSPVTMLVPVPGPTVTVTATATATTTAPSSTQQTIQVVSVAADNSSAAIVVNGTGYNVTPGEQFTKTLKLLTLTNGTTAQIQYGDAIITLSAGQSTTVG